MSIPTIKNSTFPFLLILFIVFQMSLSWASQPLSNFSYSFMDVISNATQDRSAKVSITLMSDEIGYWRAESINGSLEPTSSILNFNRWHPLSPEMFQDLSGQLIKAGLFRLPGSQTYKEGYSEDILVNRLPAYYYYGPPISGPRQAIRNVLFKYIHKLHLDDPYTGDENLVTEGDTIPAKAVSLQELLTHPTQYYGKRVQVTGYYERYDGSFYSVNFGSDQDSTQSDDPKRGIWLLGCSKFAKPSDLNFYRSCTATVEGIFYWYSSQRRGKVGWIQRITKFEPIVKAHRIVTVIDPIKQVRTKSSPLRGVHPDRQVDLGFFPD